jgi:hypothetical protein
LAAVLLALTATPIAAIAQDRETLTVTAAPMWLDLGGTDFSGLAPAAAFELQVRYSADPQHRASVAVGYHWSRHRLGWAEIKVEGLYIEPRYTVTNEASIVVPFFTGRLSSLMLRGPSLAVFGNAVGAGAGLTVKISSQVQLETAVGLSLLFFPTTNYTPRARGTTGNMRIGVGVNL